MHLFLADFKYDGRAESSQQRSHDPQSLKYLVFKLLQKEFADTYSKYLGKVGINEILIVVTYRFGVEDNS